MNPSDIIEILMHGNQLKRTARTGWGQRGVPDAEDVAAHSFGTVYTAMVLVELVDEDLDFGRVLAMAALHDLPESLTTDIPRPAWRFLPEGSKQAAEAAAMSEILSGVSFAPRWAAWWAELIENQSREAQLVHHADKLDQYLQALVYQQRNGNEALAEFWLVPFSFYFPQAQEIYDELRRRAGYP